MILQLQKKQFYDNLKQGDEDSDNEDNDGNVDELELDIVYFNTNYIRKDDKEMCYCTHNVVMFWDVNGCVHHIIYHKNNKFHRTNRPSYYKYQNENERNVMFYICGKKHKHGKPGYCSYIDNQVFKKYYKEGELDRFCGPTFDCL